MSELNDEQQELEDEFETRIRGKRKLIEKGRREKGESFWKYLGLIGTVGWSVVIPMVIGVLAGLWIDTAYKTGYNWKFILLVIGLMFGCINAWRLISRER